MKSVYTKSYFIPKVREKEKWRRGSGRTQDERVVSVERQWAVFGHAVAFVIGFSLVFVLIGSAAGLLGRSLAPYMPSLRKLGAAFFTNFGYLGHMRELYAMWTWLPLFLTGSFAQAGVNPVWASAVAFAAIGLGGLGSLLAGRWADQLGRTTITSLPRVMRHK